MKIIIKTIVLTLLLAFSYTLPAQTEGGIEKQKAAITALINKGDCDGAQAKYNKVKVTGNVFPDIEKRIADCKKNKSANTTPSTTKPTTKQPAPKPTLDVTPQTLSFTANGGSKTVTVKASSEKWYKTNPQENWVSLATKGNTVTVKVSANTKTQQHSTSFKVVSGNLSKTISIKQEGAKPKSVKPNETLTNAADASNNKNQPTSRKETKLTLSSYSESFKAEGESKTITVSARERESFGDGVLQKSNDVDWYIGTQPDASWISYTKYDNSLIIKVSPNTQTTKRTDYFTVKCGNIEKRFDITQAAATPAPKPKPVANSNQTTTPTNNQSTNPIKSEDRSYGQWVDLGLPSGTLWKNTNETNSGDSYGFYTYDQAMRKFGDELPTKEQLEELRGKCTWTWSFSKKGYNVVGPNGNSIFLPAAGFRFCDGYVSDVGSSGFYWSSTPDGSDDAWDLYFSSGKVGMNYYNHCYGLSVRLVQD